MAKNEVDIYKKFANLYILTSFILIFLFLAVKAFFYRSI